MKTYTLGLFWPEDSVRFLPYTMIFVLVVYGFSKWREGKREGVPKVPKVR